MNCQNMKRRNRYNIKHTIRNGWTNMKMIIYFIIINHTKNTGDNKITNLKLQ